MASNEQTSKMSRIDLDRITCFKLARPAAALAEAEHHRIMDELWGIRQASRAAEIAFTRELPERS